MSPRAWMALSTLAMLWGYIVGWSARVVTTGDKLTNSIVTRYLAEREYYNRQADKILTAEKTNKEARHGKQ